MPVSPHALFGLDAPLIKVGQQVKVTVGALTDRTFDARIVTMGAGLDPATRRLSVRAEVLDPDQLLKPEMFATFHIALGEVEQAVSVPAKAVIYKGNQASVWLALENRHFELRTIRTGIRDGEMLAVTEGLQRGAQVVTGGALFIDRAARID